MALACGAAPDGLDPDGLDPGGAGAGPPPLDGGAFPHGDDPGNTPVRLAGSVQKGPFVIGSTVTVALLDDGLNPTGQVFTTQTLSDRGDFALGLATAGPIALQGEGFYHNEVSGTLSTAAITLRAFYLPSGDGAHQVFVNMVSHLTAERTKTLVSSGTEFRAAVASAEGDLLRELAITEPGYASSVVGTSMNMLGGDSADNAYLVGVSATLIQLALDRDLGSVDASLQETLNALALDLADGTLEAPRKVLIRAALRRLDTASVKRHVAARLEQLGSAASVPNIDDVLDRDSDGVANGRDVCPFVPDTGLDTDGDGHGDACDACPATPCPFECLPAAPGAGGPVSDICYQPGTASASCRASSLEGTDVAPACDADLRCAERASVGTELCPWFDSCCLPIGGEGDLCSDAGQCGTGLACVLSSSCPGGECCLASGDAGQPCHIDGSCNGDLNCGDDPACDLGGPTVCCLAVGGLNQPCEGASRSCDAGLDCSGSEACGEIPCCRPAGNEGQDCIGAYDHSAEEAACNTDLSCIVARTCGFDPICNDNATCNGDLACVFGASCAEYGLSQCCLPAGDRGEACFGRLAYASQPACHGDLSCVGGTACDPYDLEFCCEYGGDLGETCLGNWLEGDPSTLLCNAGLRCASGDRCQEYGVSPCCTAAGGPGEPCRDVNAESACDEGSLCVSEVPACDGTGLEECCLQTRVEFGPCAAEEPSCNPELECVSNSSTCENLGLVTGCCLAPADELEDCTGGRACADGLGCRGGPGCSSDSCCFPAGGPGEVCTSAGTCDAELICVACDEFEAGCCVTPAPAG